MSDRYVVAIVGSGPAGLSAAARAGKRGIPHVLLERTPHFSDTIYKYQKRKHVMAMPAKLPLRSDLEFEEGSREAILEAWDKGVADVGTVNVKTGAEVVAITGSKGQFQLKLASGETLEAENVVLAIGLQGNLRKLGVPGSEAAFVQYQLDDPDMYTEENIVVIGGGDAGIENALGLMAGNNVTMVNNQGDFPYAKPANAALIQAAIKSGQMQAFFNANAKKVEPGVLTLTVPDGEAQVACDRIIARIGALPPRKFVESCGIVFPSPAPTAFPQVSDQYESNVPGLYIIGALAGYPLIKNCMNQGYEVIEFICGNQIAPADEPLIQGKLDPLPVQLSVNDLLGLIRERLPIFEPLTTVQLRELLGSAEIHYKQPGEVVFEKNDFTNSFFSIIDGEVDIYVNQANPDEVVTIGIGQFFGEMGLIAGRRRTATVKAHTNCLLLEVPRNPMIRLQRSVPQIKRAIDEVAIVRQIRMYLAPKVDEHLLDEVVRTSEIVAFKPNEVLIEEGANDNSVYLLRTGSVTISRKLGGKDTVLSYVPAGNYVGEMALLTKRPRSATVKAAVATEAIKIDSAAFRALVDKDTGLRSQVESKLKSRLAENARTELRPENGGLIQFLMEQGVGEATDVLLIDEALCVRCDNCEKACAETHHGVSRLNREAGPTFASIHVPTSCRHCEHPHCMKDCPADAIKRDKTGEVYITADCIGCGNCERNCPYGVIQMAAVPGEKPGLLSWLFFGRGPGPGEDKRPDSVAKRTGGKHAVKCDMCKGDDAGPACVRACPTGAAIRVNPEAFIDFVRERVV